MTLEKMEWFKIILYKVKIPVICRSEYIFTLVRMIENKLSICRSEYIFTLVRMIENSSVFVFVIFLFDKKEVCTRFFLFFLTAFPDMHQCVFLYAVLCQDDVQDTQPLQDSQPQGLEQDPQAGRETDSETKIKTFIQ